MTGPVQSAADLTGLLRQGGLLATLFLGVLAAPGAAEESAPQAVPVEAAAVEAGPLAEEVTAVGTLRSNEAVVIRPEIAGLIKDVQFEEGASVEQGAPLFTLDDTIYRAELTEARARLSLAKSNFDRIEELYRKNAATGRARDEARSELQTAEAAVQLAEARLGKTQLVAPFSGIVGLRRVSPGDYVNPGQDLVNLADIDPIKVDFRIAERFLSALRTGQAIRVGVDAFPDRTFEGRVYAIDPLIDPDGRSIILRATIPNGDRLLRPGLFARVTLVLDQKPSALTVPEQAIVPRGEASFVFRIVEGKAQMLEVETGLRRRGRVEITAGLAEGDLVVTAGQLKIRDGTPVKVVERGGGA